ncbi:MAG: response regulator transcription factor [Gemmatimonadaceae bacterium]
MASILVVEDNEDLAFGLRRALEGEGHTVRAVHDGASGLDAIRSIPPELVILDVMLPHGIDGFQTLAAIRGGGFGMPVLFLTARGDETDKVYGFRLGADDFVTKPFSLSELLARVTALLRRSSQPESESGAKQLFEFGDIAIDLAGRIVTKGGERVALTPKEFDLLVGLVQHPGIVLSRIKLLQEVWGHSADIMTRTVDIHIAELRRKLEDDQADPRHFVTVRKSGYRFDP